MFKVGLYARVRHACHVEGLSTREAALPLGQHQHVSIGGQPAAIEGGLHRLAGDR